MSAVPDDKFGQACEGCPGTGTKSKFTAQQIQQAQAFIEVQATLPEVTARFIVNCDNSVLTK